MNENSLSKRAFLKGTGAAIAGAMASRYSWGAQAPSVVVIGAGLSGLYAAQLLADSGAKVTVLEGRDRVGGRVLTLDDVPGRPEAGGQTIGAYYGRMLFLAQKYGLELGTIDMTLGDEAIKQIYHVGGERVLPNNWADSKRNPFPAEAKHLLPDRALSQLLGTPPFSNMGEWHKRPYFEFDVSVGEFLRDRGFNEDSMRLLNQTHGYGRTLDQTSLLFMHRNYQIFSAAMQVSYAMRTIKGGNQRLPEAMAAALPGDVLTGRQVTAVRENKRGVEVICADGVRYQADYVVSSLPLATLRHVEFEPKLPPMQREAAAEVPYSQVYQAHFEVTKPFWEGTGFMPNIWSDTVIERVFATDPGYTGALTNLTVWINGEGVEKVKQLPDDKAEKLICEDLFGVLPEARSGVKLRKLFTWNNEAFSNGGFAVWAPGQIKRYVDVVSQPAGRVHFAGEHTARWASGMEGALESGERAAYEILDLIA
ncbi:MAG: flavin monoamine oxidase family protein [Gammaproteobacteria bacterium]